MYNQGMQLFPRCSMGATVEPLSDGVQRLSVPENPGAAYCLAQLDEYARLPRRVFPRQAPVVMELSARVSAADLPGTWGFGLWNDPFTLGLGVQGSAARLPVLPNAAWFFYASPPNYLAFHDTHPAQGFLAATFSSPLIPSLALAPGVLGLPLLALPATTRLLRRMIGWLIKDDARALAVDVTAWHTYRLAWERQVCRFWVDGERVFETHISPRGRLALVIWIDNQYAAFPPHGRLRSGTLSSDHPAWLEISGLTMQA